ncbi:tautomerase PptA [Pluralibacter gergoviae]|uniref:Tautomerase PptA n=1 Tax=Pluralibacter gergoviae TaxID=61647 RepID=A0AAI9DIH3_PLUGE|nr:tautomerase PptA [Pluralibacter gergoviae]AIR01537.1 Tautomerase PptA [Pluralibacter gergoviae]EKV0914298.1 tautomerase PptA [Pluralibacter gergoviae]EKV9909393.1 tautomerase PptA [Pluralibacter gergoviae]EKW7272397.1 tautomerase PptA [Pluralibacter gergoviae]ELD4294246.1 tautomerase PptA [Pluralibacter gergoviae]
MPHIDIKCFPRELSDEQKRALAADVAQAIARHLGSKDRAISIALREVNEADWKTAVWDCEIAPQMETLIKKPGYSMS